MSTRRGLDPARAFARGRSRVSALLLVALAPLAVRAQDPLPQASGAEVVRGRISDSTGAAIAGASVVITGLQTQAQRATRTDARGNYRVLFGDAEGSYVVIARAIGYQPQGIRIRRAAESSSPVLLGNIVLSPTIVVLDTIAVGGGHTPKRGDVGGAQTELTRGALFSLDPSDLEALAARAPGVAQIGADARSRRYSVLGASPDQNRTTIDGSTVVSPQLPPDAIAKIALVQTTYDPSQGGFAGGQVSVVTRGGNDALTGHANLIYLDPHLAWADPSAPTPTVRNTTYSAGSSGPIRRGHAYFNAEYVGQQEVAPSLSLTSLRRPQRDQFGLSTDTIAALQTSLGRLGVPIRPASIPLSTVTGSDALFSRFDFLPTDVASAHLTLTLGDQRFRGSGVAPLSFPSLASTSGTNTARAQLTAAAFIHGLLSDFDVTAQTATQWGHPLLALPHGVVRVGTTFPDGQTGLTQLGFGGASSGLQDARTRTLDLSDGLTWTSHSGRNQLKLGASMELQRALSNAVQDPFGTYSFQSMEDLAANRPSGYTRMIATQALDSRTTSNAAWLGGTSASARSKLRLEYGVRLDQARVGALPAYNPTVDSAFGVRTDRAPHPIGVTPRLGFAWRLFNGEMGQPVSLSGGVGGFRGVIPPSRVAGLTNLTGLPDASRLLTCAGAATPVPAWDAYAASAAAVPTACLDGTAPAEFGSSAPAVAAFDPTYQPPTAWRTNLGLEGLALHGWAMTLGATYSLTAHAESQVDLNLRRSPAFRLANEGDRAVYVTPDAIVPATGTIAEAGARIDDRFAGVTSYRSDLRAVATQFTVTANPPGLFGGRVGLSLIYLFNAGRAQRRAFDSEGSTSGDPFAAEWVASGQPVHTLRMSGTFLSHRFSNVSLGFNPILTSGRRYTPMVGGDVNGDGRFDDRAFLFDPATTADTSLARQMSALLSSATRQTRRCLLRQLGRLAAPNSCTTGWHLDPGVQLNLALPWTEANRDALDDHLHLHLGTNNALGALLRVAHLDHSTLGSLTSANYPTDPVLAYVSGFDPAARSFQYRINQQFGEGRPQRVRSAQYAGAFQTTLSADLAYGGPRRVRLVEQLELVPSDPKAPLYTTDELRRKLANQVASPFRMLLALRDSLFLTDQQIAELTRLDDSLRVRADSLMSPIAEYVTAHGRKSTDSEIQKRMTRISDRMIALIYDTPEQIAAVLTPRQIALLPPYLKPLVEKHARSKPER